MSEDKEKKEEKVEVEDLEAEGEDVKGGAVAHRALRDKVKGGNLKNMAQADKINQKLRRTR